MTDLPNVMSSSKCIHESERILWWFGWLILHNTVKQVVGKGIDGLVWLVDVFANISAVTHYLRSIKHMLFLSVLYTLFCCLPENLLTLIFTKEGKKKRKDYLPKTLFYAHIEIYCCFNLSIAASKINQYQRTGKVQTFFDNKKLHNCLFVT